MIDWRTIKLSTIISEFTHTLLLMADMNELLHTSEKHLNF